MPTVSMHGFGAGRKSLILEVPAAGKALEIGRPRSGPRVGRGLRAAGAVWTPQIDDSGRSKNTPSSFIAMLGYGIAPGPEIFDLCCLNGPILQRSPLEKVGAWPATFSNVIQ